MGMPCQRKIDKIDESIGSPFECQLSPQERASQNGSDLDIAKLGDMQIRLEPNDDLGYALAVHGSQQVVPEGGSVYDERSLRQEPALSRRSSRSSSAAERDSWTDDRFAIRAKTSLAGGRLTSRSNSR